MKCYALHGEKCMVLTKKDCDGCAFYKCVEIWEMGIKRAHAKIKKLSPHKQWAISEKYYGSTYPWGR